MPNAVGDVYEMTYICSLHGQQINTVRHYDVRAVASGAVNVPTNVVEAALAAASVDAVDAMKLVLSNEWSLTAVKVQKVKPTPRSAGVLRTADAGPGSVAASSLPSVCSAVVRLRTAFAGPRYRGRNFFAGIPVTQEVDSKINQGFAVQLEAVMGQMIQSQALVVGPAGETITLAACLYGRKLQTVTDITGRDADLIIRTQRRREVGKGV